MAMAILIAKEVHIPKLPQGKNPKITVKIVFYVKKETLHLTVIALIFKHK